MERFPNLGKIRRGDIGGMVCGVITSGIFCAGHFYVVS
jgi:hypothetical protein